MFTKQKQVYTDSIQSDLYLPHTESRLNANGFYIEDDASLTSATAPFIKIESGASELSIQSINNNGSNDVIINGYIISGALPGVVVDQQNISIESINPYTGVNPLNDKVHISAKSIFEDNIRFIGLGIDQDATDYNQTVIAERLFDTNKWELVLFKGNKQNNRIRLDAEESIIFQTNSAAERLFGTWGITRMLIDNTKIECSVPVSLDVIDAKSGAGITIDTDTSITAGDILTTGNIKGLTMNADTLDENTLNAGVTIDGVLIKDNNVDIPGILTVDTINENSVGSGVTIDGVLIKDGNVTFGGMTFTGNLNIDTINEYTPGSGVTIDSLLIKDSGIVGANINVTAATLDTITSKTGSDVIIEGVTIDNNDVIIPGQVTASICDLTGSLQVDLINEYTLAAGVTIDSVLIKDDEVTCDTLHCTTLDFGGTIAYNILEVDIINERTLNAGVTIETMKVEDETTEVTFDLDGGKKYVFKRGGVTVCEID